MRIPSQFNDSSLYRPRRGESNRKKGVRNPSKPIISRRLFRMGVALLLVIVVMRQAKQPGIYRPFLELAGPQTVRFNSQPDTSILAEPSRLALESTETSTGTQPRTDANTKFAFDWVQSMETSLQQSWIGFLSSIRLGKHSVSLNEDEVDTSLLRCLETVSPDYSLSEDHGVELSEEADAALNFLESYQSGPDRAAEDELGWENISQWAAPLMHELHMASIQRISDATVWVGGDSDAFNLSLLLAETLRIDESTRAGVLPLLDQPTVYLGQVIGVAGKIQLAEKVSSPDNRVGISDYWRIWMIPDDGGKRPFQLVCPELPAEIESQLTPAGKLDLTPNQTRPNVGDSIATGEIAFVGRFLKRISYRSSIGADLAPVLVGKLDSYETQSITPTSAQRGATDSESWAVTLGLILAVLAGIAIAGGIMFRVKTQERRSQKLRRITTSDSLEWESIADPTTTGDFRK